MQNIEIKKITNFPTAVFNVNVISQTTTSHSVTLQKYYYKKLTGVKITPEDLLKKSFEFLLAREPNTSILSEFDLSEIAKYFPEYEREMERQLSES